MENTPKFTPPLESRSLRKISAKSNASGRGMLLANIPSSNRPRKIVYESLLELKVLYLLLADPNLVDIREQFPKVKYKDQNGRSKHHVFDFLATMSDERRVAIAVKPAAIVEKSGFRTELITIRKATPLALADQVALTTERSFTEADVRNAEKLHEFKRTADPEADAVVNELLLKLTDPISVKEFVSQTTFEGRGFRALFRAIYSGAAKTLEQGDISYSTTIMAGEQ